MQNPEFQIYRDKAGFYRWRLVARNGEPVAASEAYKYKQTAIHSAYRVKEIAADAEVIDITFE